MTSSPPCTDSFFHRFSFLHSEKKKLLASLWEKKIWDTNVWQWLWAKKIHIRSKRTGVSDDNSLPWLEHPRDFSDPDCTNPPTNWQPRNTGATISFLNRIIFYMIEKKYSLEFQADTVTAHPVFQSLCLLVPFPVTITCLWCPFWFPCCERADNCTDKQRARMVKSFQETTFANLPNPSLKV